jgi:hypothetical protein
VLHGVQPCQGSPSCHTAPCKRCCRSPGDAQHPLRVLYTLHPGQEASASNPYVHPTRTSCEPRSCLPAPAAALPGWRQRSTCAHCAAVPPAPASCPAEGQTPQQSCRGQARQAGGGGGCSVSYGKACDGNLFYAAALHPLLRMSSHKSSIDTGKMRR